jgi:RNA polymerase sigma-70 factor (ECF subfamily)
MVDAMVKKSEQAINDELVIRAKYQADALGELYDIYYKRIYKFCVHRLFNREAAEDVTGTVFLEVAKKISGFKGVTESEFRNWLYAIAANHANNYIRKSLRRKKLLKEAAVSIMEAKKSSQDLTETPWPKVYQALMKLTRDEQTIVTFRFFEKLSFEQISSITGVSEQALRVKLHRSIKKLRTNLTADMSGEL